MLGLCTLGLCVALGAAGGPSAWAQQSASHGPVTGLPLPRFVSLKSDEVNLRTGPGFRYPVEWTYRRQALPVMVTAEYDVWRRIRDWEGAEGWVHKSMLSARRTIQVVEPDSTLHRGPDPSSPATAYLGWGVLGDLEACSGGWCQAAFDGAVGWLPYADLYGALNGDEKP